MSRASDEAEVPLPPYDERVCDTCKHWDPQYSAEGFGLCRVQPPTIALDGEGAWPSTMVLAWCGAWARIPFNHPRWRAPK